MMLRDSLKRGDGMIQSMESSSINAIGRLRWRSFTDIISHLILSNLKLRCEHIKLAAPYVLCIMFVTV